MTPSQSSTQNSLLSTMTPADFALLQPDLHRAPLKRLQMLVQPNKPITTIYFPEGGIVSIVAIGPGEKRTEVGIFGREGMSGVMVLLGSNLTSNETYVQVDGTTALHIAVSALVKAMAASPTLRALLLRYVHVHAVQLAAAVATLSGYKVEQRLARWLLMCHDRLDGDDVAITHEFMGMMLGTRRAGVTEALHALEGQKLIRANRGHVIIWNRPQLVALAGGSYGQAESEYQRLIGPLQQKKLVNGPTNGSGSPAAA